MSFVKPLKTPILLLLFSVVIFSCVKGVDLDQTEEIALTPDLQVSLLVFDVTNTDFIDKDTGEFTAVIRDTVRLEFLDDSYIQDDLNNVEFSFRYTNSFPQPFRNKISFLSENDRVQHSLEFEINKGEKDNPAVTEWIEFIENERIDVIKKSIKMVVEIEVLPNEDAFEGELKFESKGLFSFEF
ncbi:hypothetical protein BC962_2615 [Gillisia mitskevichiae]|uniref:Uncharacterized protein n=1 Tax=Gillisia mitskevichiae TaxID=270921 RepID=A0A495P375_9FLAO|nr:hypothetical protein [Gillisia mitskevichiae]RKS44943.1 hypothetical protein BC962_2615 [Gillisia mitskevichiae]